MIIGTYCKSFTFFQKLFPKNLLLMAGIALTLFFNVTIYIFEHFDRFCQLLVGFGELAIDFF